MKANIGIDWTGNWTPEQYAIDAGWHLDCIRLTVERGISDEERKHLTESQQAQLLEWCRDRTKHGVPSA